MAKQNLRHPNINRLINYDAGQAKHQEIEEEVMELCYCDQFWVITEEVSGKSLLEWYLP